MSCNRSRRRYFVGSNRRWDRYNRLLVGRSFVLLNSLFFLGWKDLLSENNRSNRGRPFKIPNALIYFLAKIRAMFYISFRVLQSIARSYCILLGLRCIHYTNIFRRMRAMRPFLIASNARTAAAIDFSGLKITIRGDHLGAKWNRKRKGWSKLHVVV